MQHAGVAAAQHRAEAAHPASVDAHAGTHVPASHEGTHPTLPHEITEGRPEEVERPSTEEATAVAEGGEHHESVTDQHPQEATHLPETAHVQSQPAQEQTALKDVKEKMDTLQHQFGEAEEFRIGRDEYRREHGSGEAFIAPLHMMPGSHEMPMAAASTAAFVVQPYVGGGTAGVAALNKHFLATSSLSPKSKAKLYSSALAQTGVASLAVLAGTMRNSMLLGRDQIQKGIQKIKGLRGVRKGRRVKQSPTAPEQEARAAEWKVLKKESEVAQVTEQAKTIPDEKAPVAPEGLEKLTPDM